mgnify:CR=1 FL=1
MVLQNEREGEKVNDSFFKKHGYVYNVDRISFDFEEGLIIMERFGKNNLSENIEDITAI